MLVLTRKVSQKLVVGNDVTITVVRVEGNKVRLGIQAPAEVPIFRQEVLINKEALATEKLEHAVSLC